MRQLLIATVVVLSLLGSGCVSLGKALYQGDQGLRRSSVGFLERVLTVGDHDIEVLERPGAGDAVLLVHGFSGSKDSYNRIAPFLPADLRLIAPSLPSHGASTFRPDASYDFASQADRLAALLDGLAIERVHVVGVSMGGAIATTFAARHPQRTLSLSAIAPAGIDPPTPTAFQSAWAEGENLLIVRQPEDFERFLELCFYGEPPAIPGPVRDYLAEDLLAQRARLEKVDQDFRTVPGWLEGVVPQLRSPVLVVWGKQDEILHVSGSSVFRQVKDVRIELLEGCGHACSFVRPEEVALLVSSHIRTHAERAAE